MIVTGGGRGIGAATARLAAKRGYAVCVNYLSDRASANALVQDIRADGGSAIAVAGDVAEEKDVLHLFEACDRSFGPLAALVNNAGIVVTRSRVEAMGAERLQRMFLTNVLGPFLCAREAIKRMSTKHGGKGGAIVNVSSVAARLGSPGEWVDYAASKGALETLTLALAPEFGRRGITVNSVLPGVTETDMNAEWLAAPEARAGAEALSVFSRVGRADDIADVITFLASNDARWTTGQMIDATGGARI